MKRTVYTLLAAFCCYCLTPPVHTQAQEFWNGGVDKNLPGTGSTADPFLIRNADQLAGLAERVNAGENFQGLHIRLEADLYMSDPSMPSAEKKQWTPISGIFYDQKGAWEWTSDTMRFCGNFDGGGHTIYHLYYNQAPDFGGIDIDDPTSDIKLDFTGWNKGLFGYVEGGTISNLKLENDTIVGAVAIGGIAAINVGGTISHCSMTGFVGSVESGPCGGIVGQNTNGTIEYCVANATSKGTRSAGVLAGTSTGAQAVIRDCHAEGRCHVTQYRAGGFCGSQFDGALIERCSANVEVSNASYKYAAYDCAGFVSNNDGIIRECYSTGNVTSPKSAAGFVACNVGHIESCYSTGDVTVGGYGCTAAAFVGQNGNGEVSYGEVVGDLPGVTINCFATGKCSGSDDQAALQGFQASYWNESQNSSRIVFCSYDSSTNPGIDTNRRTLGGSMAKTTQEMQSPEFVDTLNMVAAWMGTSTWTYRPGEYPIPTGVKATNLTNYIGGGDGTKGNPYIIGNKEHLSNLATMSNLGWDFRDQYILQTADIDLNRPQEEWGEEMPSEWTPIGQGANRNNMAEDNANAYTFRGHYDGGYHEVRNMYINGNCDQLGFFGVLNHGATIKNLGITHAWAKTVTGNIGLLAGCSSRYSRNVNIVQCWTSGRVESAGWGVGGILGQIALEGNTNILNCASSAHIMGTTHVSAIVGDQNYIGGETYSNDTIANFIFSGTFDKEGYCVPMMERERLFNALYDSDVYKLSDDEEQVRLYGGHPTTYLQSKNLANILNYWIDQWNATHALQLDYYNQHDGKYLATESGFTPPYKVTFDSEGGSALTAQSILEGSQIEAPAKPTQDGKVFAGWYADSGHTQVFDFGSSLTSDITLHAKWLEDFTYDLKPFQNPFATSYVIRTKEQLLGLAVMTRGIKGVQDATDFTGKTVKLGADILLNDTTDWTRWGQEVYAIQWSPIGQYYTGTFNGTFDGQGHTISGLYQCLDKPEDYSNYGGVQQGLFGNLGPEARVSNVRITASALLRPGTCSGSNTYGHVGLLAGVNKGQVENCHTEGLVEVLDYCDMGGLIGQNWGQVANCSSKGCVISHDTSSEMGTGGLIGYSSQPSETDTIQGCTSSATVQGRYRVGGLIGNSARGVLRDCHATGNVCSTHDNWSCAGGLAGEAGNLMDCSATGCVSAPLGCYAGGLVGRGQNLTRCHATGQVTGRENVGGLVGGPIDYDLQADSCYATGQVSGSAYVGGLAGRGGLVSHCHSTGLVRGTQYVGGLIGGNCNNVTDCYSESDVEYNGENADGQDVYIGGLVGQGYYLSRSHATGRVQGAGGNYVGGLAGKASDVTDCHATGNVSGGDRVGGLAGALERKTEDAHASGSVEGRSMVGGLTGQVAGDWNNGASLERCMASGRVTATSDFAGGLVGILQAASVTQCYAEGDVTGTSNAGGLMGSSGSNSITHCYARGSVTGDGTGLAGLIGDQGLTYAYNCYATGHIEGPEGNTYGLRCNGYSTSESNKNYYDRLTTGQSDDRLDTPCTTEEMHRMATFAGWDFETVWGRRADINDGYPYLRWSVKESLPNDADLPLGISSTPGSGRQGVRKVLQDGEVIILAPQGRAYKTNGTKLR